MASVERRTNDGKVMWQARWRDPAGAQRKRSFARKSDAERWLTSVEHSIHTGGYVDPAAGRTTVAEYAGTWLTRQTHLRPSTRSTYTGLLRCHVLPTFGALPLAKVERSAIGSWVAELAAVRSASTTRQTFRVLSLVLAAAVADDRIARNPAAGVKTPRTRTAQKRFLTHVEVAALVGAAGDDGAVMRVLAYCGIRFEELAALRVRHVDPLRRRLTIAESASEVDGRMIFGPPKSGTARSVPIPRSLVEPLAAACAGKAPDSLVFTAPEGGVIYLRNWRRRVFAPAVAAAGLDPLTVHELRHTAASLAVAAGANVKSVQRMLGHASAAMTLDIYSGLFDDDLDAVADRMDEAAARAHVPLACPEASIVALVRGDSPV